jgi:hypothetical protein
MKSSPRALRIGGVPKRSAAPSRSDRLDRVSALMAGPPMLSTKTAAERPVVW